VNIKVVVETKCALQRTIDEANRVLMFRGKVVGYIVSKTTPDRIDLMIHVAETWKLEEDKFAYLKIWLPAKFKVLFKVILVDRLNLSEKIAQSGNLVMLPVEEKVS
jgi:hypothetical protein